jgi:hypothetical protein
MPFISLGKNGWQRVTDKGLEALAASLTGAQTRDNKRVRLLLVGIPSWLCACLLFIICVACHFLSFVLDSHFWNWILRSLFGCHFIALTHLDMIGCMAVTSKRVGALPV